MENSKNSGVKEDELSVDTPDNSNSSSMTGMFKPLLGGSIFPPPPPHIPVPPQQLALPIFDHSSGILPPPNPNRTNNQSDAPQAHMQQLSPFSALLEPDSETIQPSKKRKRSSRKVKIACVNCKKSHTSCSVQRPCERCIRLGLTATCVDTKPKKRGRKRKPKDTLSDPTQRKKRKINNETRQTTQIPPPQPLAPPQLQVAQPPPQPSHPHPHHQTDFLEMENPHRLKEDFVSSHCFGLSSRYQRVGLLLLQPDVEGVISVNWTMRTWLGETGSAAKLSEMTSHRERILEEIRKNENPVAYDIEIENIVFNNRKSGEMVNTKVRVHIMYDAIPEEVKRLLVILFIEKIS